MRTTLLALTLTAAGYMLADTLPVHHLEGRVHGFLLLTDLQDNVLAAGDSIQFNTGDRITNELIFHFKDGSLQDETAVFTQRGTFRLLNYHLVQKGKTFKHPMDVSLDATNGQFTVLYTEEDGKEKTITERLKLPPDLANGIIPTLIGDIYPSTGKSTVSMVVATPKPRIVKLEITQQGEDAFTVANTSHKAVRYDIKVDIGGVAGVVAPMIGKQPPDTTVWMVGGSAPGFLRSESPLYEGGPVCRIQLASPTWSK